MLWDGPLVYSEDQFKEYIGQLSNPCQSMPILNNSVPIPGQFVTNRRTDEIGPKHKPRRQYRTNLELPLYPQHIKLDWHCIGNALAVHWLQLAKALPIPSHLRGHLSP